MSDVFKFILDLLKLSPRYFAAGACVCWAVLFAPERVLSRLGLLDFANHHRNVVGLVFLVCTALTALAVLGWGMQFMAAFALDLHAQKRCLERLKRLTEEEKQILRHYIWGQTKSNTLRFDDGVVQGLVAENIIFQASSMGNVLEGFAYNISDTAWKYLNKHPALLRGETDSVRCDKRIRALW